MQEIRFHGRGGLKDGGRILIKAPAQPENLAVFSGFRMKPRKYHPSAGG